MINLFNISGKNSSTFLGKILQHFWEKFFNISGKNSSTFLGMIY